ncbi:L-aspartate oxidase [Telmatospirillum siberiense]|uniref:L-aspartate oxidase n=1 Tax=Telmatospirillum siberiense TaxID=382514 RepID=A0A2N3PTV4_9PROT|nr:L-aspartate oxidase [Telmatospirillum siberiense]PKU23832.1 L-aspartate oxidase [Telmatospirillum siberiense]
MSGPIVDCDVLVIGSGAGGLTTALQLAPDVRVALLSKGELAEGSTYYAQGGIAAVLDTADSTELHISDTLVAGDGLCDPVAVRFVVENARKAIEKLIGYGVEFTRAEPGGDGNLPYHLTREGGHSRRRIIHAADATGRAVETTLEKRIRGSSNVAIYDFHLAIDLVREKLDDGRFGRCVGAYALDRRSGVVTLFRARVVVLATGGASKVYLYSSNPDACTGDGIAMAWRAGCRVANLEFMQFHPTCLYHPQAKSFLISEAVRGEGGRLLLPNGERFMPRFDERAELAPRDVVARAIDHEIKRLGIECVHLDISHQPADFIIAHFPTIHAKCLELGIDITRQPMPVVPAAHYTCGGVMIDEHGRTDVPGLYAVGEVSFTGLHGANRMASNSLLECLVYGASAAADITGRLPSLPVPSDVPAWDESWVTDSDDEVVVAHNWDELRRFMWDYVGIVRSGKRLERARHRVDMLRAEIAEYYGKFRVGNDLLELRNLALVAELIIRSAMARRESRGLHYTLDYPHADPVAAPQNTILVPEGFRLPSFD